MPADPCKGCKFSGKCCTQGLVNRLAIFAWLEEQGFECADYDADFYHGVEGGFA